MDFSLLKAVIDELAGLLPGARVDKVLQGADNNLYLVLHQGKKNYTLFLSLDRSLPAVHLVSRKPSAAGVSTGFFQYLKKYLTGARIRAAALLNQDRVAELRISGPDTEYRLIFELIGASSNLILTDPSLHILAVYHPVPPGDTIKRPLLPGFAYALPEKPGHSSRPTAHGSAFAGEIERAAGGDFPANQGAEAFYDRLLGERREAALKNELAAVIKRALAKAERRIEAVSKDLTSAGKAEEYRRMGGLILANMRRLERPADRVELSDYDGRPVVVPLDPGVSLAKNAERYFKKYKKSKAGMAVIEERLKESQEEAAFLKLLQGDLLRARDASTLSLVRSSLVKQGHIREERAKRAEAAATAPPFRKIEYSGWEILVGKSAAGNDYITMKLARPDDLWFHAEGMPGSHVLVRNPGRRDVPPDVLRKAASLAAYYSKGKGAAKVPVAYTFAKYVKKPKGAKPGTVLLSERKTVTAVPGNQ